MSENEGPWFSPDAVGEVAGVESLSELTDPERAFHVVELIVASDDVHILTAPDGTIYRYNEGEWSDDGEQGLREIGHKALHWTYGVNVHRELCRFMRENEHTSIDPDELDDVEIPDRDGLITLLRENSDEMSE